MIFIYVVKYNLWNYQKHQENKLNNVNSVYILQ